MRTASHPLSSIRYEHAPSPSATASVDSLETSTAAEPAKTACGPRVGVLLWADEQGPANISGMPWSMREALARAGCKILKLGIEAGTDVKVVSGQGELRAPLAVDPGVPAGSAVVPANAPGNGANILIDASAPVTDVRVERA